MDIGDFVYFVHRYPDEEEDDFVVSGGTITGQIPGRFEFDYMITTESGEVFQVCAHCVFTDKWRAHGYANYWNEF